MGGASAKFRAYASQQEGNMLSQGYSFQIDRPADVEAKSIEGPVDSAFQSTGGKETFAILERLLVPLSVEAAKGAAEAKENKEDEQEEEQAYRLLCLLRLLDDNFVAYQKRERLNNGEEKTVTIRVASSASSSASSLRDPVFVQTLQDASGCLVTVKAVLDPSDVEGKVETRSEETKVRCWFFFVKKII